MFYLVFCLFVLVFYLLVNKEQKEHKTKFLCGLCILKYLQQGNYIPLLMRWILKQMKYTTRELKNSIKHNSKERKSFETILLQFPLFTRTVTLLKERQKQTKTKKPPQTLLAKKDTWLCLCLSEIQHHTQHSAKAVFISH